MRGVAVAAVTIASAAAAGCGGSGSGGAHGTAVGPALARGRTVFAGQCASCHTLTGREQGAVGGDLVNAHLGARAVASFARVMPTPRRLSPAAAAAVGEYVAYVARSKGRKR